MVLHSQLMWRGLPLLLGSTTDIQLPSQSSPKRQQPHPFHLPGDSWSANAGSVPRTWPGEGIMARPCCRPAGPPKSGF